MNLASLRKFFGGILSPHINLFFHITDPYICIGLYRNKIPIKLGSSEVRTIENNAAEVSTGKVGIS